MKGEGGGGGGVGASNQLGYYLAGLIEGDGSIILRKGEREKKILVYTKIVFTTRPIAPWPSLRRQRTKKDEGGSGGGVQCK